MSINQLAEAREIVQEFVRLMDEGQMHVFNTDGLLAVGRAREFLAVPFSESVRRSTLEENNLDSPKFFGAVEEIDQRPLTKSAFVVFDWMARNCLNGQLFFTHEEVSKATGVHITTVGNRIRDFRMEMWGSHNTPRRRRAGTRMWEYSMIPNRESLTYDRWLQSQPHPACV